MDFTIDFNISNLKDGTISYVNRTTLKSYQGQIKNKLRHGHGIFITPDVTYIGKWENDKPHGEGMFKLINQINLTDDEFIEFNGLWNNGEKIKGTEKYKNGLSYVGEFKNNMKHGNGKLYDKNYRLISDCVWENGKQLDNKIIVYNENGSIKYEGEMINGKKNGIGISYELLNNYDGEWRDDVFIKGKIFNKDNILIYDGGIMNYKKEGFGIEYYLNSLEKYNGEFKDDKYDGKSKLYNEDGTIKYKGEFKNGEFNGQGKLYYENNKIKYDGIFDNDVCIKGTLYRNNEKSTIKYIGQFNKSGKQHGTGQEYYENGSVHYIGNFNNNNFTGYGVRYYDTINTNGSKITEARGIFLNGKLDGENCKIYYLNGNIKYEGEMTLDKYNGDGILYYENTKVMYDGHFVDGNKVGDGTSYYENGSIQFIGKWTNDNYDISQGDLFDDTGNEISSN